MLNAKQTSIVLAYVLALGCGLADADDHEDPDPLCDGEAGLEPEHCDPPVAYCEAESFETIGDCDDVLGWAWDGDSCFPVTGCECAGPTCGYESRCVCECRYLGCSE